MSKVIDAAKRIVLAWDSREFLRDHIEALRKALTEESKD
tara:strand:+ start:865 stop:981 length:117 start_codon:yes stop_codon:yes gene_type:complete